LGPYGLGENVNEAELLASCYQESLKVAVENNLASIAFPPISPSAYGYPVGEEARVAINAVADFLKQQSTSIKQ
jgi:O-acetyl-ADP-ribose deacetylase (regulator of RNase III)